MAQNRFKWVDNAKGLAMISVVLCHVVSGLYEADLYPNSNDFLYAIRNICNIFQMPLFCMVSGYLYDKAYIDKEGLIKKERLLRQIKSLLSIYVLWCLIMGVFKICMSGSVNFEVKPLDLALIWFKPIGVYWYLYVLVGLYVLFALRNKVKVNDVIILVFLFVVGLVASLLVNNEGSLFAFRRIAYYAIIFYLGTFIDKLDKKTINIIAIIFGIVAISLTVLFWNQDDEIYHIPIVNLFTAIGYCIAVIALIRSISDKINLSHLSYVGKNSLDIYLLHVFFAAGGRMVINKIGNIQAWISVIGLFVVALYIPLLIGIVLRKLGLYDIFFKPYIFIEKHKKTK